MEKLYEIGTRMGLEGQELRQFITEQQKTERDDREREREEREKEREEREKEREREEREKERQREEREKERERDEREKENERKEREIQRQHELSIKQMEVELAKNANNSCKATTQNSPVSASSIPKLPPFVDQKDDLDSYLNRFERFAKSNGWEKSSWATCLSALLTGRALDVYSRMPEASASDYDSLKEALLKRYELTESGFRNRFRNSKSEAGESPEQFCCRLKNYLTRWIELSGISKDFDSLCSLLVKDQFIASCLPELAIHLKERAPADLQELAKVAEQYLQAHGKSLSKFSDNKPKPSFRFNKSHEQQNKSTEYTANFLSSSNSKSFHQKCAFCSTFLHKSENCPKISSMDKKARQEKLKQSKACFLCLKVGKHVAKDCYSGKTCEKCGRKHNVLICEQNEIETNKPISTQNATSSLMSAHSPKVLLMTASVNVKSSKNQFQTARVLIDGGSQRSYIRSSSSESVKAEVLHTEHLQIQSFGEKSSSCNLDLVNVQISSKDSNFTGSFKLLSSPQICSPLETVPYGPWIEELKEKGYRLADEIQNLPYMTKNLLILS